MSIRDMKIESIYNIQKAIQECSPDSAWLMFNNEHCDKIFETYVSSDLVSPSFFLSVKDKSSLIVAEIERENVKIDERIRVSSGKDLTAILESLDKEIQQHSFPGEILLNYSAGHDPHLDQLGHGTYIFLIKKIEEIYARHNKSVKFSSAQDIFRNISVKRTSSQINGMKISAQIAHDVLHQSFLNAKPGMTEIDLHNIVKSISKDVLSEKKYNIVEWDFAWPESLCPIVLAGENLQLEGHTKPSSKPLNPGDTIYFDFGITLTFSNGVKVSSDIQRMGYLMGADETVPPQAVLRVFDVLSKSIDAAASVCRPGATGFSVHEAAIKEITQAGFPAYNHATGHSIGELAHAPGPIFATKGRDLAEVPLVLGSTFTIEPRIQIPNGGSIEEMVLVQENGVEFLSARQTDLWINHFS